MFSDLIDKLLIFAQENNLKFTYCFNNSQGIYLFKFYDQEQTWGYCREITKEQLDQFNGPIAYFAHDIIETIKQKVPFLA